MNNLYEKLEKDIKTSKINIDIFYDLIYFEIDRLNLNDYVHSVDLNENYVNSNSFASAYYSYSNNHIGVNFYRFVNSFFQYSWIGEELSASPEKVYAFFYRIVAEILYHELEHARQHKIMDTMDSKKDECQLLYNSILARYNLKNNIDKYKVYVNLFPEEKAANYMGTYNSFVLIKKVMNYPLKDNQLKRIVLRDYNQLSPYELLVKEGIMEDRQYNLSFYKRMIMGLPLSDEELVKVRNIPQTLELTKIKRIIK